MNQNKDKNPATGNKQSDFAGTNPDRYGAPKPENEQDNPIEDSEAQNVVDGERSGEEEMEKARSKANVGKDRSDENAQR